MSKVDDYVVVPDYIYDENTKIRYKKGQFFGKGGFAKCYEITNVANSQTFAGKVVSKKLIVKENQKEKMTQEIQIHKSLKHKNIVGFYSFFEDTDNIYIVLELCRKRSMMELQKRRKMLTEPETRFYMRQILNGVSYLHQRRIIHRDLKLGNLFLNDELTVKIGDFGLAATIEYEGERKKTLCGTPNYIAPEILQKKGHSFEVDIWSIGCIMYTLLVGKPPFETRSLKETYSRIKKCEYHFTTTISPAAKSMIMLMLQSDPKSRPKVTELLQHPFITDGYCPSSLPVSSLTMAPRFQKYDVSMRKPLSGINNGDAVANPELRAQQDSITAHLTGAPNHHMFDAKENFVTLRNMLGRLLKIKPAKNHVFLDEMTDPAAQPMIWVSKWVDYSDKYGFGYQLSDECVGVMFNDTTKLIMLPNGINVHYIDKNGDEVYMTMDNYPRSYDKKMKLLSYFSRYMREHLIMTGASVVREVDSLSRTPHLHQWCRSTSGVLMQLNNGTVQMNFSDHTKIIMCPLMAAITYIDEEKQFRTFRFSSLETNGYNIALYEKMRYAYDKISLLLNPENNYMN
ncbi:serine/threonine-protein kinase polo [Tribolium castaneum]|uniref:polo kinase n=1 Tax=Tribolium castaneum TaxID=7070 RepID=D6WJH0_TRICA|nr:PREDICTED: serine/threonine-protein kinase polo [Tribolium castaneum]EFA04647.1 polo [Tribolium castaneum]|eukprot:XP_972118.2 PREDICTED: serine/threonine-protein kinase polo [Tribolium castaneum]